MDSSSNDPLYYLKVIAEYADARMQKLAKAKKALPWIVGVVVVYVLAMIALPYYIQSKVTGSVTQTETTWSSVSCYRNQGDYEKALEATDKLLAKNPKDFDGYYKKGEIQLVLGDKDGALKSFQAAYDIFPVHKYKEAVDALKPKPKVGAALPGQPGATNGAATNSTAQAPAKAKP